MPSPHHGRPRVHLVSRRLLAVLACVAVGCSAGTSTSQPRSADPSPSVTATTTASPTDAASSPEPVDITQVAYGPDPAQTLLIHAPTRDVVSPTGDPTRRPAAVFVHGGAWEAGEPESYRTLALGFASVGWVAISVGYRLGEAGTYPAAEEDVVAAFATVQDNAEAWSIDPDRIALAGDSAGGHLAALAAMDEGTEAAALVTWSGLYDLDAVLERVEGTERAWVGAALALHLGCDDVDVASCPTGVVDAASPVERVTSDDPPTLLLHSRDEIVPVEDAEAMRDALLEAGVDVRLQTFPGQRHGLALTGVSAEFIEDFLTEALDVAKATDDAG